MTPDTIIWKSGCVRRWHNSLERELRDSDDTTGWHSQRVAMLILMLHPLPSAHLLACAITHDTQEILTGDMPGPAKVGTLGEVLSQVEAEAADALKLPRAEGKDALWISMCDKLDALLWVRDHCAWMLHTDDWMAQWASILNIASALNVRDKVEGLLS